ncbi:MAG: shikimate kinase [Thaumarchaeota archaeon]|nr:shikimate kinase [Nitrososphaerota archaeon]
MKAKARVHGAVSILNAIPTGIGGAIGVDLWTEVEVEFFSGNGAIEIEIPEGEDPALAEEAVKIVLEHIGKKDVSARVKTSSNIPIGRGLKSSSAAANAVVLAACKALGLNLSSREVVNLSIDASIKAGVTVTGAFDDAYTSFFGGINIADNYRRQVLLRSDVPEDLSVLILVPDEKRYTRSIEVNALKNVRKICVKAMDLALSGKFWDAMTLNGVAISTALDMDPIPALEALRAGALGAGISGTGPAVAAVAPRSRAEKVSRVLERHGRVLKCRPNNSSARVEILR